MKYAESHTGPAGTPPTKGDLKTLEYHQEWIPWIGPNSLTRAHPEYHG